MEDSIKATPVDVSEVDFNPNGHGLPRQLQTDPTVPDESRSCIPFDDIRSTTVSHPNTDESCLSGGVDGECSVCCRVFEWLVCDRTNVLLHLPCVCNRFTETFAPTIAPTQPPVPTSKPTAKPTTVAPTAAPTERPTPLPTVEPTKTPTLRPTETPSSSPVTAPSASPTASISTSPTASLSTSPTESPSTSPTENLSTSPTESLSTSPTANPTGTPSIQPTGSPTSKPSSAPSTPPSLPPVLEESMLPTQSLTSDLAATPAPTLSDPSSRFVTQVIRSDSGELIRQTQCKSNNEFMRFDESNYTFAYELSVDLADQSALDNLLKDINRNVHRGVVDTFVDCFPEGSGLWGYETYPHSVDSSRECTDASAAAGAGGESECFIVMALENIWTRSSIRRARDLQALPRTTDLISRINAFIQQTMAEGGFTDDIDSNVQLTYLEGPGGSITASPTSASFIPTLNPRASPASTMSPTAEPAAPPAQEIRGPDEPSNSNDGLSDAGVATLSAFGVLILLVLLLLCYRRCICGDESREKETSDYDYDNDNYPIRTFSEDLGDGSNGFSDDSESDPFTSASPTNRSKRPPLYSQDELDQAVAERLEQYRPVDAEPPKNRRGNGLAGDTVDL